MLHSGKGYLLHASWITYGDDREESYTSHVTLFGVANEVKRITARCKSTGCVEPRFVLWKYEAETIGIEIAKGPLVSFVEGANKKTFTSDGGVKDESVSN